MSRWMKERKLLKCDALVLTGARRQGEGDGVTQTPVCVRSRPGARTLA